jgi:hypothetical protein
MPQHQELVLDWDTPQYWRLVGCKTTASPEQAAAIIVMYSSNSYMFVAEKCNKSFNTRFAIHFFEKGANRTSKIHGY